eukprot:6175899-Pleurochrysis_carterae.AAC.2
MLAAYFATRYAACRPRVCLTCLHRSSKSAHRIVRCCSRRLRASLSTLLVELRHADTPMRRSDLGHVTAQLDNARAALALKETLHREAADQTRAAQAGSVPEKTAGGVGVYFRMLVKARFGEFLSRIGLWL